MDMIGPWLVQALLLAGPILFAVTVHELAHGYVADRLGDPTARLAGRLTLNPLRHLDLMGTLAFFITQAIGWAKPVPINPANFRRPRRDMIWVSLAGPAANLVLALIFARVYLFFAGSSGAAAYLPALRLLAVLVTINVGLAVFNLLPIPPLDGSHVLEGLLPAHLAVAYDRIRPYGFFIILALIFFGLAGRIIRPTIHAVIQILLW